MSDYRVNIEVESDGYTVNIFDKEAPEDSEPVRFHVGQENSPGPTLVEVFRNLDIWAEWEELD